MLDREIGVDQVAVHLIVECEPIHTPILRLAGTGWRLFVGANLNVPEGYCPPSELQTNS